jgi:hypothetical protein
MASGNLALNFDDLLSAVQESQRGRWFLDEYGARLRKGESQSVLAAISKLEHAMAQFAPHGDAALLAKARATIAQARKDICMMPGAAPALSEEARLFAKLADMARTALSVEAQAPEAVRGGVTRALALVDQLESDLGSAAGPTAKAAPDYFAQDSAVFAAPAPAAAAPKVAAPVAPVKEVERGAKLVIRKSGGAAQAAAAPAVAEEPVAVVEKPETPIVTAAETDTFTYVPAPPVPAAQPEAQQPAATKASRVVIIRRKPEELMSVPLPEGTENAA